MAIPDRISEKLKLIGSKKNSLRNVILMLAMEWKDLDEQLESTEECVQGTLDELRIRENNLESVRESVRELEESVKSRTEELETRKKGFIFFQETQIEEMKMKEKQLETMLRSANELIKEAERREERLTEQHESLEELLEKLELEKEQLEHIKKAIDQRFEEFLLKETYFEGRSRELDSIQNWINRRAKELDTKEEQVDDSVNELKLEEELICKSNEERCKELESKEREIYSAQKLNEERSEKLESKEKQLDAVQEYINESFKDFHSKSKQLKLDIKLLEERSKELESKEKQLEEQCEEVESREKQFVNTSVRSCVKAEQVEDSKPVDKAEIQFVVTMDGRSLQLFLNERSLDDESMSSEVYRALQLSLDSGKLVLDAMDGFYPPHLKKGDVGFEEDVVRRTCIVLLEQLMKISPLIKPRVKEDALKLAEEWKEKMRAAPTNYLAVLGFLQLLASYKLASGFDADELLKLFAVVAEHNEAPDLCRVLGFTERIPDLIENFVKEKQELVAVKLSFGFRLCDKFPPVPLLRRYLERANEVSEQQSNMGQESREAQDKAVKKEVAALSAVINCIELHGLESQYSPENLKTRLEELLRWQRSVAPAPDTRGQPPKEVDKRSAMQSLASMAQPQEQDGRKCFATVLDNDPNTPPQQHSAKRICRDPVSLDHPFQSLQQRYQHPPVSFSYLNTHYAHYSLGASTPVPAMHMSHTQSEYGSGTPASGGFPPFGVENGSGTPASGRFPPFGVLRTEFGSVPNFNAKPYTVAGTPHYSLSQPGWS